MEVATMSGPLRVLIVDDCPDTTYSLCCLLRAWGHDVRATADGPSALELDRTYRPDVILLDLGMPGMDGFEVARRLRGLHGTTPPLVVCVSGWCGQQIAARSVEAGCHMYLTKPADPEAIRRLLECWRSFVRAHQAAREGAEGPDAASLMRPVSS